MQAIEIALLITLVGIAFLLKLLIDRLHDRVDPNYSPFEGLNKFDGYQKFQTLSIFGYPTIFNAAFFSTYFGLVY